MTARSSFAKYSFEIIPLNICSVKGRELSFLKVRGLMQKMRVIYHPALKEVWENNCLPLRRKRHCMTQLSCLVAESSLSLKATTLKYWAKENAGSEQPCPPTPAYHSHLSCNSGVKSWGYESSGHMQMSYVYWTAKALKKHCLNAHRHSAEKKGSPNGGRVTAFHSEGEICLATGASLFLDSSQSSFLPVIWHGLWSIKSSLFTVFLAWHFLQQNFIWFLWHFFIFL